jgi:hypothetical protein
MEWLKNILSWLNENKEWLFSGVGMLVLTQVVPLVKEIVKIGPKEYRKGYYFTNILANFRYHKPKGQVLKQDTRKIISMCATQNKLIEITYPVFATGKIVESHSVSDPGRMEMPEAGETSGIESIKIQAEKKRNYLIVSENKRSSRMDKINKPDARDLRLSCLYSTRVVDVGKGWAGTVIIARTKSVRVIVEFSNDFKPETVNPVQISDLGKVIRDERHSDFVMASENDKTLFILDLANPQLESGVYLWWSWPELPKRETK